MALGAGDKLARGHSSAQFEPANVSEEKWKSIFGEEGMRKLNAMDEKDREKLIAEAQAEVDKVLPAPEPSKKIRPVLDRIWVTRYDEPDQVNGLFIPDEGKEKPAKGIVKFVGPGKWVNGDLQAPSIVVGDKVVFGKFSGAEVQIGLDHYVVLREEDIFGAELD
jgi:chaperonin GroES